MPADKFTKKATTPKLKRQWQHVYDSAKASGADSGSAVRQANAAMKRVKVRQTRKPKRVKVRATKT